MRGYDVMTIHSKWKCHRIWHAPEAVDSTEISRYSNRLFAAVPSRCDVFFLFGPPLFYFHFNERDLAGRRKKRLSLSMICSFLRVCLFVWAVKVSWSCSEAYTKNGMSKCGRNLEQSPMSAIYRLMSVRYVDFCHLPMRHSPGDRQKTRVLLFFGCRWWFKSDGPEL